MNEGLAPQALVSGKKNIPRYYIYHKARNRSFVRNEYKIRKWLVLKFHGSGHLPNHTTSK
jgi:hypothetical protein